MGENNNVRKSNIAYLLIGVLTLVVAIAGATYAYFTATDTDEGTTLTGNMATIQLNLSVEKVVTVDDTKKGLIPMSNGMVERAINNASNAVCVDDNTNAVCQVFKFTLTNDSSAVQFVDGYVSLRYGSRTPTDYDSTNYVTGAKFNNNTKAADGTNGVGTTMRWAQVFPGDGTATTNSAATGDYSTAGVQILGVDNPDTPNVIEESVTFTNIGAAAYSASDNATQALAKAHNTANIRDKFESITTNSAKGVVSTISIAGTTYDAIGTNYIRVSNHNWGSLNASGNQTYTRTADPTSALVINHSIQPNTTVNYYIVTWLSETGTNQNPESNDDHDSTATTTIPAGTSNFFDGNVTFVSAQGSEVSATFSEYLRVESDQTEKGS